MSIAPSAVWFGTKERRLFGVFHSAGTNPRAGVVFCSPFFHELTHGYRLFALLGDALAAQGIAVLRFDYYGTGDSDGEYADFSLRGARADTQSAIDWLAAKLGAAPLFVLGIRAGALAALDAAQARPVRGIWLWQPVLDVDAYLADLRILDASLRALHPRDKDADAAALMGHPVDQALLDELRAASVRLPADASPPVTVLDADGAVYRAEVRRIGLPTSLHAWIHEIDVRRFPLAPVRDVGGNLSRLPELS